MKVLVVVDAQNDFITGLLGSEEAQSAIPAIAAKIDEYMKNTDLVVFTQDTHYDNYMETDEVSIFLSSIASKELGAGKLMKDLI